MKERDIFEGSKHTLTLLHIFRVVVTPATVRIYALVHDLFYWWNWKRQSQLDDRLIVVSARRTVCRDTEDRHYRCVHFCENIYTVDR